MLILITKNALTKTIVVRPTTNNMLVCYDCPTKTYGIIVMHVFISFEISRALYLG